MEERPNAALVVTAISLNLTEDVLPLENTDLLSCWDPGRRSRIQRDWPCGSTRPRSMKRRVNGRILGLDTG
jgi:hypothetical protein